MNNKKKYSGVIVPAVTPLTQNLKLDHEALAKMFNYFHEHHAMPFINGTTGESSSLSFDLKKEYLVAAGKLKSTGDLLYAGISANCFEESVTLAKIAFDNGADAVVAMLPSYYILSEDQMLKYFEQLAEAITGPVIIYNIPLTTRMSIPLDIIDKLSRHENIIGTKDSERSDERLKESLSLWSTREDFCHFLGWAPKSAEALINGSDGLVPSTGNFCPGIYNEMVNAVKASDHDRALKLQKTSDAFGDIYQRGKSLGESLWALKVLMNDAGLCAEYVAPPLYPMADGEREKLLKNYRHALAKNNLPINANTNV
ncbi:MAG: dihydrodipicolinate synthase family protein [Bacteroidetes bacterium]|jgi:4-hydroxy-tetrahydrodipicolinate synthase|nr:dihydrodipicolinate synthase family protein [Bacteroidota bacterium]